MSLSLSSLVLRFHTVVITSDPEWLSLGSTHQLMFGRAIRFSPNGEYWRMLCRISAQDRRPRAVPKTMPWSGLAIFVCSSFISCRRAASKRVFSLCSPSLWLSKFIISKFIISASQGTFPSGGPSQWLRCQIGRKGPCRKHRE